MKRNDIVSANFDDYIVYGRINRKIGPNLFEVIDCGKYVREISGSDLTLHNDYKGYMYTWGDLRTKYPVWHPMPSLRRLKQKTCRYRPEVFRKNRKKHERNMTCEEIWTEKYGD